MTTGKDILTEAALDEGSGMGPTTLSVGSFMGAGKYHGALMIDIQGDAKLGHFYDGLADYAKKLGVKPPPIEKVTGSFNYGASSRTYLFFELAYDDEADVIETMRKAKAQKCQLLVLPGVSDAVMAVAKELKARIAKR